MPIKKGFNALPKDGSLAVIENNTDNNRTENTFCLLMSLNILLLPPNSTKWKESGFKSTSLIRLTRAFKDSHHHEVKI